MALGEDKILFQLGIKGVDPGEAERITRMTGDQLVTEMRKQYEKLRQAHAAAEQANTKETVKESAARVKAETNALAAMEKVRRAMEIAQNKQQSSWRRTLEDMENFTVAAYGIAGAVTSGLSKFKAFSEEAIRTTQIYNSLRGSIDSMREATEGEVADIDLITAKNRAMQKELKLTDEQFANVAKVSKQFADALGTDTADALNQLIDGLATGRTKMLQHVGIMIDAKKAQEDYARSIGKTVEELTEEEKLHSLQEAALDRIKDKAAEAAVTGMNLASALERVWAMVKNVTTGAMAAIGNIQVSSAKSTYVSGKMPAGLSTDEQMRMRHQLELEFENIYLPNIMAKQQAAAARARALMTAQQGEAEGLAAFGGDMGFTPEGTSAQDVTAMAGTGPGQLTALRGKAKGGGRKGQSDRELMDEIVRKLQGTRGLSGMTKEELYGGASDEALDKLMGGAGGGGLEDDLAAAADKAAKAMDTAMGRLQGGQLDKDGLLARALFGPAGSEGWADTVNQMSQQTIDAFGGIDMALEDVKTASEAMFGAFGNAMAAAFEGEKSFKEVMQEQTKAILQSLAAQAYAKAAMQTAEGIASLALGPIGGVSAAGHFAAAAAFAAVGTAAGLGARAIPGGSGATTGMPTHTRDAGRYGSAGGNVGQGGGDTVTINIGTIYPGGEAEAGRQISRALEQWEAKTGRKMARA